MMIYLTRITPRGHERYYKIISTQNLFGEFLVIREYGNTSYKKPTRTLEKCFESQEESTRFFINIKNKKIHRGYVGLQKCA